MASSKRNVDHNLCVNSSFVFSLPLSPAVGIENDPIVEAKIATVDRKRKATWEDGGLAKRRRNNWETDAKKQLFSVKNGDKKNILMFKAVKQPKVLRKGGEGVDDRVLFSADDNNDDQAKSPDFPSTRGNTHGKVKVTVLSKKRGPKYIAFPFRGGYTHGMVKVTAATTHDGPTKKDKKINWRESIIPLRQEEAVCNARKSLTRRSNPPKNNINNNSIPYVAVFNKETVRSN